MTVTLNKFVNRKKSTKSSKNGTKVTDVKFCILNLILKQKKKTANKKKLYYWKFLLEFGELYGKIKKKIIIIIKNQ